jgi:hypothetical protein
MVDLSFHLRTSVGPLRMNAMQINLSKLVKRPSRSFASVSFTLSLLCFLRRHHINSADARHPCKFGQIEPPAKTGPIAAQVFSAMKIRFNDFLQNAAFPAVVLAFACSSISSEIPDVRTGRLTDHLRSAKMQIRHIDPMKSEGWYQPTKILPSGRIAELH